MSESFNHSYSFTSIAWNRMYETVDHEYFLEKDTDLIFDALNQMLKPISFGAYLQRYIYRKCGMTNSFSDVPIKDYQTIIMESFRENGTPASFTPTTAKLSALAKNWLTQQTVKRHVVLLLGFGLKMSVDDVNDFLYKALHEPMLNIQDPQEAICLYCYEQGLGYYKYQQLWDRYEQTNPSSIGRDLNCNIQNSNSKDLDTVIQNDDQLINYLAGIKSTTGDFYSDKAYSCFLALYDQARDCIAQLYNTTDNEEFNTRITRLRSNLQNSERLYDFEKIERIQQEEKKRPNYSREDISESDLEHILCSAIPVDSNGNLTPAKRSTLNAQFEGKRFSRKHLNDILLRKTEVERFDLITINFFIFTQKVDQEPNAKKRYMQFIESTNKVLEECSMGPIYVTNPYECFVLMCMLSISPLETYTDVWEKSYEAD